VRLRPSSGTGSLTEAGDSVFAVILAGGGGTRLWPVAHRGVPKPFLSLDGGASLFRRTYDRIVTLVGASRVLVVTAAADLRWVRRHAPEIPRAHVLSEGAGRDTAAAVALAALWLRSRLGDAFMVVLPADHVVRPASVFRSTVRTALAAARNGGMLVTLGVPAGSPDPGFGYIRPLRRGPLRDVATVREFVEKPSRRRAVGMVRSGRYLWNSGIFVWKASAILSALESHRPDIVRPLRRWTRRARPGAWRVPEAVMRRVPRAPIDRAVLERSRDVLVVRAPFAWSDVGNWNAAGVLLRGDTRGNAALGRLLALDARRCLAVNPGGLTVILDLDEVVVVRSDRTLLVCHRRAAHRVREVVGRLEGPLAPYR